MTTTTARRTSHLPDRERTRRTVPTGTVVFIDPDLRTDSPALAPLVRLGIGVRAYADGLRALARMGTDRPVVVVVSSTNDPCELTRVVEVARAEYSTPVLIALADGDVESMAAAIFAGARPTLDLPLRPAPLLAELLRVWPARPHAAEVQVGRLVLDPASYDVRVGAQAIDLSALEFDLLHLLAKDVDHVVPRVQITRQLWPTARGPQDTLVAAVARLRRKLSPIGVEHAIHTVRGIGYRLDSGVLTADESSPR